MYNIIIALGKEKSYMEILIIGLILLVTYLSGKLTSHKPRLNKPEELISPIKDSMAEDLNESSDN